MAGLNNVSVSSLLCGLSYIHVLGRCSSYTIFGLEMVLVLTTAATPTELNGNMLLKHICWYIKVASTTPWSTNRQAIC